jgi:N-acetylmuramoyl-L-alanine amidase
LSKLIARGRIANNANAKAFVSIHINAPNVVAGVENPIGNGTSALYNVNKSGSFNLADEMARAVSSSLGVNNRGAQVDDGIAVLKPTVTSMNAVLLEAARLSGRDEQLLHAPDGAARVAAGVLSAIRSFFGQ